MKRPPTKQARNGVFDKRSEAKAIKVFRKVKSAKKMSEVLEDRSCQERTLDSESMTDDERQKHLRMYVDAHKWLDEVNKEYGFNIHFVLDPSIVRELEVEFTEEKLLKALKKPFTDI